METQQALRMGRHKTLSDVLFHALEFEAAREASRGYIKASKVDTLEALPMFEELMKQMKDMAESKEHVN